MDVAIVVVLLDGSFEPLLSEPSGMKRKESLNSGDRMGVAIVEVILSVGFFFGEIESLCRRFGADMIVTS